MGTLEEATVAPQAVHAARVEDRVAPGRGEHALEFSLGDAVVGVLQAGGRIDAYTLVYVGDRWALMAGTDQLFTVTF